MSKPEVNKAGNKALVIKSKFGTSFGFKGILTPKKIEPKTPEATGFDAGRFKTQHKG